MPGMEAPEGIAKPFAAVMSVVLMTASSPSATNLLAAVRQLRARWIMIALLNNVQRQHRLHSATQARTRAAR
jgi:hypothetical protein